MLSPAERAAKLWSDARSRVEFAGDDPVEARPCMLGMMSRFLRDHPIGDTLKRTFAIGMAAIAMAGALTPAMAQTGIIDYEPPPGLHTTLDPGDDKPLYGDKSEVSRIFTAIAADVNAEGMDVATLDIKDLDSITAFKTRVMDMGGTAELTGQMLNEVVSDDHGSTPVALSHYSILNEATGEMRGLAVVSFDGDHNHFMKHMADALGTEAVEAFTYAHELSHAIHKQAEQSGLVSFIKATNGDFSAFEKWDASVEGQLTHPDVRQVIQEEVARLQKLNLADVSPSEMSEYVGKIVSEIREIQSSDGHILYQEHIADAMASLKFVQDGHAMADELSVMRAGGDALHDTSSTQRAIAEKFNQASLEGLSAVELASLAAHTVKTTLGTADAGFAPVNDGIDNTAGRIIGERDLSKPIGTQDRGVAGFEAPYDIAGIAAGKPVNSGSKYALTEEREFEAPYDIAGIAAGKAVEPGTKHALTEELPVQGKPFVHPGRTALSQLSDPAHYAAEKSGFEAPYDIASIAAGAPVTPGSKYVLTEEQGFEAPYNLAGIADGTQPPNPGTRYTLSEERPAGIALEHGAMTVAESRSINEAIVTPAARKSMADALASLKASGTVISLPGSSDPSDPNRYAIRKSLSEFRDGPEQRNTHKMK